MHHYFKRFQNDGTWGRIYDRFYRETRLFEGREESSSCAVIECQSGNPGPDAIDCKGYMTPLGGASLACCAVGKKIKGRKRHTIVDSVDLILR